MRLWVIGTKTGGTGDAIVEEAYRRTSFSILATGTNVDVTNPKDVDDFVNLHNPIHHVVYCVGINKLALIQHVSEDDYLQMLHVNVVGFVNVLKSLTNRQHQGNVVAISSDSARTPMRASIMYCSSKAALDSAVKVAARELAPNWRINAIAPSIIAHTNMSESIDDQIEVVRGWNRKQAHAYEMASVPMKRRARKDEVAKLTLDVLLGPEYMTGSIVDIRGGK